MVDPNAGKQNDEQRPHFLVPIRFQIAERGKCKRESEADWTDIV